MALNYKNPLSSVPIEYTYSVTREEVFGTHYSVLGVGGYMEVFTLEDLKFNPSPPGFGSGTVEWSGNTIPIHYNVPSNGNDPATLLLNNDNISSGRRRLGMLVYVYETDTIYQFHIPNYTTYWDNAVNAGHVDILTHTTVIRGEIGAGNFFVDAWLNNNIEGVDGVEREDARWRIFKAEDKVVTGGALRSKLRIQTAELTLVCPKASTERTLQK